MVSCVKSEKLSPLSQVSHGFFKRSGGVSSGLYAKLNCRKMSNDITENVQKNRELACGSLSPEATLFEIKQTHSATVHTFDGHFIVPEADAVVTNQKNIALSVVTADCAPVLLADPVANIIGAAHAGWKGAATGIIKNTVSAMVDLGAEVTNITAAIGPCIAQKSYEVGPDLFDQISDNNYFIPSTRDDHHLFDLESFVSDRLWQSGVTKIDPLHIDTYDETNNFFSYRRHTHMQEDDYGCQISIILQH